MSDTSALIKRVSEEDGIAWLTPQSSRKKKCPQQGFDGRDYRLPEGVERE